ncbi:hypothetical protein AQ611_00140 [Burkholderia singularis]|nr:hypothetical protein AQ611_00140 [Burkholderia sp. Bp7605]
MRIEVMKRSAVRRARAAWIAGVAALAAAPVLAAAPDLDAVLLHESRAISADGVTRTVVYRERMVRRAGHVWVERVRFAGAARADEHDDHVPSHIHDVNARSEADTHRARHASAVSREYARPAFAHAHAGHKHFNFDAAARHVTNDGGNVRIEYVDAAERTIVSVPPTEFETTGFDGSWDNAFYITPPSQLKRLNAKTAAGPQPGTRWYEQTIAGRGLNRILWSDALQAPLVVEYRSTDGSVTRKLTLTPAPRAKTPPWRQLASYSRKEYEDYLD